MYPATASQLVISRKDGGRGAARCTTGSASIRREVSGDVPGLGRTLLYRTSTDSKECDFSEPFAVGSAADVGQSNHEHLQPWSHMHMLSNEFEPAIPARRPAEHEFAPTAGRRESPLCAWRCSR